MCTIYISINVKYCLHASDHGSGDRTQALVKTFAPRLKVDVVVTSILSRPGYVLSVLWESAHDRFIRSQVSDDWTLLSLFTASSAFPTSLHNWRVVSIKTNWLADQSWVLTHVRGSRATGSKVIYELSSDLQCGP